MSTHRDTTNRDSGSILVFVLVLVIISSLIVLPILTYGTSVIRANEVVSERTAEAEAVKAGFRFAVADPYTLYESCASSTPTPLATPGLAIATTTTCSMVSSAPATEPSLLPVSLVTTFTGVTTPVAGAGVIGPVQSAGSDAAAWRSTAHPLGTPFGPGSPSIWLPNLPVHGKNVRSGGGYDLPAAYEVNGYEADGLPCKVYFPGTYTTPVNINTPTFFTSGVYYFESTVTLSAGADVVAGEGKAAGCGDNQHALFYATGAPNTHNITGFGATFVFGDSGRLVINDAAGPVKLRMNQRYVPETQTGVLPSDGVSIMTVNGTLDGGGALVDMAVTDSTTAQRLSVPFSLVDSIDPRPALQDDYTPSILTPTPRISTPPGKVTATAFNTAAVVRWPAPESDGGSPIIEYIATANPGGQTCQTAGERTCAIIGLANDVAYTFTVEARNAHGLSTPSDPSDTTLLTAALPNLEAPSPPANLRIESEPAGGTVSRYTNALVVSWDAESNPNVAPITGWSIDVINLDTVTAADCAVTGPTSCVLDSPGTSALGFQIEASASNVIGSSAISQVNVTVPATGETYTPPPPPPPPAPFRPTPIIDVNLVSAHQVVVEIPGYIAVPQGVVRVNTIDPANKVISLGGGVLSSWVELGATLPAGGTNFDLGIVNPDTQRTIRIETRSASSDIVSVGIVQVNENGASAINAWTVQ